MIDLSCYGNTLKTQKGECIKDAEREIDGCTLVPQWRCIFEKRTSDGAPEGSCRRPRERNY